MNWSTVFSILATGSLILYGYLVAKDSSFSNLALGFAIICYILQDPSN